MYGTNGFMNCGAGMMAGMWLGTFVIILALGVALYVGFRWAVRNEVERQLAGRARGSTTAP